MAEREHAAVPSEQPVSAAIRLARHADDRLRQVRAREVAAELRVAVRVHATGGVDEPVPVVGVELLEELVGDEYAVVGEFVDDRGAATSARHPRSTRVAVRCRASSPCTSSDSARTGNAEGCGGDRRPRVAVAARRRDDDALRHVVRRTPLRRAGRTRRNRCSRRRRCRSRSRRCRTRSVSAAPASVDGEVPHRGLAVVGEAIGRPRRSAHHRQDRCSRAPSRARRDARRSSFGGATCVDASLRTAADSDGFASEPRVVVDCAARVCARRCRDAECDRDDDADRDRDRGVLPSRQPSIPRWARRYAPDGRRRFGSSGTRALREHGHTAQVIVAILVLSDCDLLRVDPSRELRGHVVLEAVVRESPRRSRPRSRPRAPSRSRTARLRCRADPRSRCRSDREARASPRRRSPTDRGTSPRSSRTSRTSPRCTPPRSRSGCVHPCSTRT